MLCALVVGVSAQHARNRNRHALTCLILIALIQQALCQLALVLQLGRLYQLLVCLLRPATAAVSICTPAHGHEPAAGGKVHSRCAR